MFLLPRPEAANQARSHLTAPREAQRHRSNANITGYTLLEVGDLLSRLPVTSTLRCTLEVAHEKILGRATRRFLAP